MSKNFFHKQPNSISNLQPPNVINNFLCHQFNKQVNFQLKNPQISKLLNKIMLVYYPIHYEKQIAATLVGYRNNNDRGNYEFGIFFCKKKPINLFMAKLDQIQIKCQNKNRIKIIYSKKYSRKSIDIEFLQSNDRQDFLDCLLDSEMIEHNQPTSITCCIFPCIAYYQHNYKFVRKKILTKMI